MPFAAAIVKVLQLQPQMAFFPSIAVVHYHYNYSLFHTAIPENTWKMCPVICPGMVWFWFIHTASDFPESVRAFTHNP